MGLSYHTIENQAIILSPYQVKYWITSHYGIIQVLMTVENQTRGTRQNQAIHEFMEALRLVSTAGHGKLMSYMITISHVEARSFILNG